MSFLLLKAFPFVAVSVVAGGFVASTFGTDVLFNTAESKKEVEGGDVNLDVKAGEAVVSGPGNTAPINKVIPSQTSTSGSSSLYRVSGASNYLPSSRDHVDNTCNLYVVKGARDENPFRYSSHEKYDSLESLHRSVRVNSRQSIKCHSSKYFYLYENPFENVWNVKVSNSAPSK